MTDIDTLAARLYFASADQEAAFHRPGWLSLTEEEKEKWRAKARQHQEHKNLWTCYQTGQMSEAQLTQHMDEDKEFAVFVANRR